MNTVNIGSDQRAFADADPHWITSEIQGRRKDGLPVCVVVSIDSADLNLRLSTPECSRGNGGGRNPNPREAAVFELWHKHHLDEMGFSPGDVVSFLKQLRQYL